MKRNLYIFGCSGIAKSIVDSVSRLSNISLGQIYFVDTDKDKTGEAFYSDYNVIHIDDLDKANTVDQYAIAAYFKPRDIYSRSDSLKAVLQNYGLQRLTVIDPSASISTSAEIGNGVYIAPNVVVDAQARIGDDSIILFNSVISREVTLGRNVFVSASVVFKGGVSVGDSTFVSAGCLVTNTIEGRSFINAGVVVNSVVPADTIVGNKSSIITINLPKDTAAAERKLRFFHP